MQSYGGELGRLEDRAVYDRERALALLWGRFASSLALIGEENAAPGWSVANASWHSHSSRAAPNG